MRAMPVLLVWMLLTARVCAGEYHVFRELKFEGNTTFSSRQLVEGLKLNSDFLLTVYPYTSRAAAQAVTSRLLVNGYHAAGFPDVQVTAVNDPVDPKQTDNKSAQLTFRIAEGPRFQCGAIQVLNNMQIHSDALIEQLTQSSPDQDAIAAPEETVRESSPLWLNQDGSRASLMKAVWTFDEPTPFDRAESLSKSVMQACSRLGFSKAFPVVSLKNDPQSLTTSLVIDFRFEGNLDRAEHIRIEGLTISNQESFSRVLVLAEGNTIDASTLQALNRKLWECGRYVRSEVRFDHSTRSLIVRVQEIPGLPAIDAPLNKLEKGLLAGRAWLANAVTSGNDLEIIVSDDGGRFVVIESRDGTLVQVQRGTQLLSLLSENERLLLDNNQHPQKLEEQLRDSPVALKLGFKMAALREALESPSEGGIHMTFSYSLRSRQPAKPAFIRDIETTPADWLAFLPAAKFAAGKIEVNGRTATMRIDLDTGELAHEDTENFSLRFRRGAFQARRDELLKACAGKTNALVRERPLTSIISYLSSDSCLEATAWLVSLPEKNLEWSRPVVRGLGKIAAHDGLCLLDQELLEWRGRSVSPGFWIPDAALQNHTGPQYWEHNLAALALSQLADVYPADHWPATLLRSVCLTFLKKREPPEVVEDDGEASEDYGPIFYYFLARAGKRTNHPQTNAFASTALQKLDEKAFVRDCELLSAIMQHPEWDKTLRAFGTLDQLEAAALSEMYKESSWPAFCIVTWRIMQAKDNQQIYHDTKERFEADMREILKASAK